MRERLTMSKSLWRDKQWAKALGFLWDRELEAHLKRNGDLQVFPRRQKAPRFRSKPAVKP